MEHRTASAWRIDTELEVFLSSKGWIQTIANQGREGIQKQRRNNQMVVQPWDRFLLKEVCITMSLSSTELEPPPMLLLLSRFSVSNFVWPHRWQAYAMLSRPWDSPGKNTGVGCHFLLQCMNVKSESEVTQLHTTLRDPMDCRLPGSSVHRIFQARVLEWGAVAFSDPAPR